MPVRLLAACGVLAPFVVTAAWVTSAALQSDYSAALEDISALGARTADHAWLVMTGLAVTGMLVAAFSLALRAVLTGRAGTVGAYLVGLGGFGIAALGVVRNDCSTETEVCGRRIDADEVSWEHVTHDLLAVPVLVLLAVAPAVLAVAFRQQPRLRALSRLSLAASAATGVLLLLTAFEVPTGWQGAVQKAAVTVGVVWLEAVALRVAQATGTRRE